MDKNWISRQFSKSLSSYNTEAIAQREIVNRTSQLLEEKVGLNFSSILELGVGTGLLTKKIAEHLKFDHLYLNDLSDSFYPCMESIVKKNQLDNYTFLKGDIEVIDFPEQQDLIISTSTEQWVKDKTAFYKKVYSALNPSAYFVFTSFGLDNLKEIREATGLGLKYFEFEDNKALLSNHFDIIHAEEDRMVLYFKSAKDILKHLKKTGVNGLQKQHWTKKTVNQLIEKIEQATFVQEAQYKLTYHPTFYLLKKK